MSSSVTPDGVNEGFFQFSSSPFHLVGNEGADMESDRWGVAFPGPSAQACLLVRARIGAGAFSAAQLVKNRENPDVLIVRKYRSKAYGLLDVDSRLENEVRIALTLEERMRKIKGPKPLMAEMIYSHDIRPADVNFWTRVSFWKYYNLGDFDKFLQAGYPATVANPSVLPVAIFARFLHQILSSIQWLMDQEVFHRDLAFRNIFVNREENEEAPNFFVGDFGCATLSSDPEAPTFEQYEKMSPRAKAQHTAPYILRGKSTPGRLRNREHWDLDLVLAGIYDGTPAVQGPNSILARYANFGRGVPLPAPLTTLLTALNTANQQDKLDRVMPKPRPALQSLRAHIATARTIEATATTADANRANWRAVWTPILADRPALDVKSWPSASFAQRAIQAGAGEENWGAGATAADVIVVNAPYRIVDLNADEATMDDAVANFDAEIKTRNIEQANIAADPDNDWSTPPSVTPAGWNNAMPGDGGGFNGNVNGPFGSWNFWGEQAGFAPARGAGLRGGGGSGGGGGGLGLGPLSWPPNRRQSPLGRTPGGSPGRNGPQRWETPAIKNARLRRERILAEQFTRSAP